MVPCPVTDITWRFLQGRRECRLILAVSVFSVPNLRPSLAEERVTDTFHGLPI